MSTIFSTELSLTTDRLVERFNQPQYQGCTIEAWLFADKKHRKAAEHKLLQHNVKATLRSAYKPLVHFFLEDIPYKKELIESIKVFYPIHGKASEKRFLLEAYPLAAMMKDQNIEFIGNPQQQGFYHVHLLLNSGECHQYQVFAPNHLQQSVIQEEHLSPTGWLKVYHPEKGVTEDSRLVTDYEELFEQAINAICQHPWQQQEPYFKELQILVKLPYEDQPLDFKHEIISLREALHEDLYFSILEWFKVKSGYLAHGREGQVGHIVPNIVFTEDQLASVQISLEDYQLESSKGFQSLVNCQRAISVEQAQAELADISGVDFSAQTITGRKLQGRYHKGSDQAVMISCGQHANETSGVVGGLLAAQYLALQPHSHFSICPLENPDGYELHQRLIKDNPCHMHHAARYTALGDDLEYRNQAPWYEKEIRQKAKQLSEASLHINLHGYPSHEWTRPLSGYVPQGFDMWTIPKGFFLILRHSHEQAWQDYVEKFLPFVTARLTQIPGLMAFNQKQIELYKAHAGESNFHFVNDIPCLISQVESPDVPVQLVTEFPDETIYGDDFVFAHQVQMTTVLAAYEAHQLFAETAEA